MTSSATRRWASSRRSAPTSRPSPPVTGSSSRSRSAAARAGCASTACRASARRPRCASRARAQPCSATPQLYGSVPGGQAEYLRVPQAQYTHIKVPARARRRPVRLPLRRPARRPGRRSRTPTPSRRAPCSCSGSARSATWRAASRCTAGVRQVIGVDRVDAPARPRPQPRRDHRRPARRRRRCRGCRPRPDRRPRRGCRGRRGRHGGARVPGRRGAPTRSCPSCPTPSASG